MKKFTLIGYAVVAYGIGMASLIYLMGFLMNTGVPKGIDSGGVSTNLWLALSGNLVLVGVYFVIHSIMARPWFKRWWTRFIPEGTERSTYVLISGITVFLLVFLWQPLGNRLWVVESEIGRIALISVYLSGWALMVLATFNIDHWSFFGLRQAWISAQKKTAKSSSFSARYLYSFSRHPISLGWLTVMWITPDMTLGHLLMALMSSLYIFMITPIEEADLLEEIGERYAQYRSEVRRFLPFPK